MDGVRLLSHRPSVLYKVEHLATEPATGDIAVEGLLLAGPGWDDRLKSVIKSLSISERACLFAVRLADEQMLPVPAETLFDRTRHRLVSRVPLARADATPLPADRRAAGRSRVRARGADARQARDGRAARRRADRRRRGPRRALLLRLPGPYDGARGRPPAAARGRGAVRQPRPARGARCRQLDAHDLAGRRPARRRPVEDLPGDHQARALPGSRHADRDGRPAPHAWRAGGARRSLRRPPVARLPRAAAPPTWPRSTPP